MRRRGRHRRRANSPLHILGAFVVVTCLVIAYTGGVTYAHWTAEARIQTSISTGLLHHQLTDPPTLFQFNCVADQPGHPLSFIRFWDPSQTAPDLVEAGTGAVKIEEDRVEFGSDEYSVDPELTQLGDLGADGGPVAVYLGEVTVWITGWFEHPAIPGRYLGFSYETGAPPVTVDVKAGVDLSRITIGGSGEVWSPSADPEREAVVCQPDSLSAGFGVTNTGTIPARVFFGLGSSQESCQGFDVLLTRVSNGEVVYTGPFCGLLDTEVELAGQLHPHASESYELELTVVSPSTPLDRLIEAHVTLVQWNAGHSDDPSFSGWLDSSAWDIRLTVSIDYPEEEDAQVEADDREAESTDDAGESSLEEADQPDDDGAVREEVQDGSEEAQDGELPDVEEEPDAGDVEKVPAEVEKTEEDDQGDVGEMSDGVEEPEGPDRDPEGTADEDVAEGPAGQADAILSGLVWEDTDGDGIRLPDEDEPGVAKTAVIVYDSSGVEVARTRSDGNGEYVVDGLEPGEYFVEFSLPKGYGLTPPVAEIHDDPSAFLTSLLDDLELTLDEIVVSDIAEVGARGAKWIGATEVIHLLAGDNPGLGDAATLTIPDELTPAPVDPGPGRVDVVKNPNAMTTEPERPAQLIQDDTEGSPDPGETEVGQ